VTRDLYNILGVPPTAAQAEIKRRFRTLAKRLHPDLNPDQPDVGARFQAVHAAYEVLVDPERRARYDLGELDPGFGGGDVEAPGSGWDGDGTAEDDLLFELFQTLFGSDAAARPDDGAMPVRGADRRLLLRIDFATAIKGGVERAVDDRGQPYDLSIPPGSRSGETPTLEGEALPGLAGGPPGDLVIELEVRPDPRLERHGADLHLELPISLGEALSGAAIEVPTIEGPVTLELPPGTNGGHCIRLEGMGVPDPAGGRRGDQIVKLQLVLPAEIDATLHRLLAAWTVAHPYDPRRPERQAPDIRAAG
jgi:DnaJ-class molecular chaperone